MFSVSNIKIATAFGVVIFLSVLDRLLKSLALVNQKPVDLVGGILKFNFAPNRYIAFSLPLSGLFLNLAIFILVILLVTYLIALIKKQALWPASVVFLVVLGAASNFYDRLRYGYVIDYLDLSYFTVFNLDDVMIVVGVLLLVIRQEQLVGKGRGHALFDQQNNSGQ